MRANFERCIFRRRLPSRRLRAILGPRRMSLASDSGGASTARIESRISMNTDQARPCSFIISPGGEKTPAQYHPLNHQGVENFGLHPRLVRLVRGLGSMTV